MMNCEEEDGDCCFFVLLCFFFFCMILFILFSFYFVLFYFYFLLIYFFPGWCDFSSDGFDFDLIFQ